MSNKLKPICRHCGSDALHQDGALGRVVYICSECGEETKSPRLTHA